MEITQENWNRTRYKSSNLLALISFGAEPLQNGEIQDLYSVLVTNEDYEEVSEQVFKSLEEAISSINLRFASWELVDLAQKSDSGCDSCAAH
jgi:hypothetical protein